MKYIKYVRNIIEKELKKENPNLNEEKIKELTNTKFREFMQDYIYEESLRTNNVKEKYIEIDRAKPLTFKDLHPQANGYLPLHFDTEFLYHGVRFDENFLKFEKILKSGKILAGKKSGEYFPYGDNCNEGKYISLLEKEDDRELEFEVFINSNISFIISPECDAIKCIYVSYEEWEEIMKTMPLKRNRFSYARYEYHVEAEIPLSMVKAIGIPYFKMKMEHGKYVADAKLNMLTLLLETYGYDFPIVDTSRNNLIIRDKKIKENYLLLRR